LPAPHEVLVEVVHTTVVHVVLAKDKAALTSVNGIRSEKLGAKPGTRNPERHETLHLASHSLIPVKDIFGTFCDVLQSDVSPTVNERKEAKHLECPVVKWASVLDDGWKDGVLVLPSKTEFVTKPLSRLFIVDAIPEMSAVSQIERVSIEGDP